MDRSPLRYSSWKLPAFDRGPAPQTDIEWERIMVQITFAFVIILGFLISKGMSESQSLAVEADRQRQMNAQLQAIVVGYHNSELGRERAQRIATERQLQLERLINKWLDLRQKRLLAQLLVKFRKAELISLADDLKCLPVGADFELFKREIERTFLVDTDTVSPREVEDLMRQVVEAAGYRLQSAVPGVDLQEISPQAGALFDDPQLLTADNLRRLRNTIDTDLQDERVDLADVQYNLVGKIATARLERLMTLPLEASASVDPQMDAQELARVMLERILADLREDMRLLPEAAEKIRGVGGDGEADRDPATN